MTQLYVFQSAIYDPEYNQQLKKQISPLILYQVTSRTTTLLKLIYGSIHVPNILGLTVHFKLISSIFYPLPPFVPYMYICTSFYTAQLIPTTLTQILKPLQFSLLPLIQRVNLLHQSMVYYTSIHNTDSLDPKYLYCL